MVPFWVPITIRHLILGYPQRGHNFDNHPHPSGSLLFLMSSGVSAEYGMGFRSSAQSM